MNWLSQIVAVTGVTLRSIAQRLGSSTVAIIGIAGVVIVFTAGAVDRRGLPRGDGRRRRSADASSSCASGSDTEMTSGLSGDDARLITEAPGIERGADGPHASPELFVIVGHPAEADAAPMRMCRCAACRRRRSRCGPRSASSRAGCSTPAPTRSSSAARRRSSSPGSTSARRSGGARAPGRWSASSKPAAASPNRRSGATRACCSLRTVAATRISRCYARLESSTAFQTFKDALTTDPRLNVTVIREREYYAQQSQVLQTIIRTIGFGIAALMGLGAIFGAVNTMYSAVSSRTREIATLRALGFGRSPVVISVADRGGAAEPGRRVDRRRPRMGRVRRLPDRDDELAVVQPGGVRVRGHAGAAGEGPGLRDRSWACSAGCFPPFARPGCPSSRRCGSSEIAFTSTRSISRRTATEGRTPLNSPSLDASTAPGA